jgi:hypothetical protein
MISDPVNGLSRRHGSVWLGEVLTGTLTPANIAAYRKDVANWVSYDFDKDGKEYVVLYRKKARPFGAEALPVCVVYNKTDNRFLGYRRNPQDAGLDTLEAGGIAALTSVGKYLFMTSPSVPLGGSTSEQWLTPFNSGLGVIWIRGGAFSRTFTVTVRTQVSVTTASYTTPSASYPGTLDTSDILTGDPNYVKKVNDRVNSYNSAVTAWVGTSTAATQPGAIASQLASNLQAQGLPCGVIGSHIFFVTAGSPSQIIKAFVVNDGGDGTLIRGVANEVESADKVSPVHYAGKVIKVRGNSSDASYYLKAVPKDVSMGGYTEVTWIEAAGVVNTISTGLYYATIVANNFCIASSATLLATVAPPGGEALTPGPHPDFVQSAAGDGDSAPMPFFVNRIVTYLGTFQNRLLVGSGGALAVSETDNYLNFFRTTVLTLPGSDPFEMLPQGSEDDVLYHGTQYDQDLILFGKRRQYIISGTVALTPTSANMPVLSSYEGVVDAQPVSAGGFIFYAKRADGSSSVHQIQPGQNNKSPESFPASSQVDTYINGGIVEMASSTGSPSHLFMRTDANPNSLFTFTYLDKQDGRKMDAWARWEFNPILGALMGMSVVNDGVVLISLREAINNVFFVADFVTTRTSLSSRPYLDSNRPWSVVGGANSLQTNSGPQWAAAFGSKSGRPFTGALMPNSASLIASYYGEVDLRAGAVQDAYFEPTNPYMRDNKGKAILSGRLTVTKVTLAFKQSTGFSWTTFYKGQADPTITFNGRLLDAANNLIGIEPVTTGQYNIPVGKETRQYSLRISARRWYPLTVTALEWSGQFFNRVQRF